MQYLVFFSIWFGVLAAAHWYVGKRIITAAQFHGWRRTVAWSVIVLIYLLPQIPFAFFLSKVEGPWLDDMSFIGYLALGFFTLVLMLVALRDVVLLLINTIDRLRLRFARSEKVSAPEVNNERRRFLVHASNIGIVATATAMTGYGFAQAHRRPSLEPLDVVLSHLPEDFNGFRILQFSDLHVGPTIKREYVEEVVAKIADAHADMIVFTGDLVDGSVAWLKDDVAPLRALQAPHGKFFITGNHEYYSGAEDWVKEAGRLEFDVLLNEHRVVAKRNGRLVLAGVTDFGGGDFMRAHRSDPSAAIAGAPESVVKILLAHQPRSVAAAATAGFDLQLSGHTHGGQYFPGNYLARLNQPYIKGLHKHDEMLVYVNRGIGYWGPPLRLGAPPELTVITLRSTRHFF